MTTQPISLEGSQIKRVANLSRLGLTDSEVTAATKDVSNILKHFSAIQEVDTKGVPAADEDRQLKNVSRTDEAQPNVLATSQELLANVPRVEKQQIKVAAVFDHE